MCVSGIRNVEGRERMLVYILSMCKSDTRMLVPPHLKANYVMSCIFKADELIAAIQSPAPARQMLPPNGVYSSRIHIDGAEYNSVSNIGLNPTVNEDSRQKTIETNIFDYDDDAYGKEVTVFFDHFSRGERKFRNKEELFAQISRDCENARNYRKK